MIPTAMEYPGIFNLRYDDKIKRYYLEYVDNLYKVDDVIYGEMKDDLNFFWKAFIRHKFVTGVILTGQPGSGKTKLTSILANRCINNGMRVINITSLQYRPELIEFLDSLDNVVLFFDEFAKVFSFHQQNKMLSLLNNTLGRIRSVLITENDPTSINGLIRNRPGRVLYAKHFNKVSVRTMNEYIMNLNVREDFISDLKKAYNTAMVFTMDHFRNIIDEHLANPDVDFKTLIGYLNVELDNFKKVLKIEKVLVNAKGATIKDSEDDKEFPLTYLNSEIKRIELNKLEQGVMYNMGLDNSWYAADASVKEQYPEPTTGYISSKNVEDYTDSKIVIILGNTKLKYKIIDGE